MKTGSQIAQQSLAQLEQSGAPALLLLNPTGRIVTLLGIDSNRALLINKGMTYTIERSSLEKAYSGQALVSKFSLAQGSSIVVSDPVRLIQLTSLDQEVSQQVTITNRSTKPITIRPEYPYLGVTDMQLDKSTLAPGETTTIAIKMKWRPNLTTSRQEVLVGIKTSDLVSPRLQLAFTLVQSP